MQYEWSKKILSSKLKILCGAGISFNSGMPLANSILEQIFMNIGFSQDESWEIIGYGIPFEGWMELFINYKPWGEELLRIFRSDELIPCHNHRLIAKLISSGIVDEVYTANFDTLIEQALIDEGLKRNDDFVVLFNEDDFTAIESTKGVKIIKFHGSIEDYTSIRATLDVITAKKKFEDRERVITEMISGSSRDSLLVLGYSCSDQFDVQPVLEKANETSINIIYVEHQNSCEIVEQKFSGNWPNDSCNSFSGYRVKGSTDVIVEHLYEVYKIEKENDIEVIANWKENFNKQIASYFSSFSNLEGDYMLLKSKVYDKICDYKLAYLTVSSIPITLDTIPSINGLRGIILQKNEIPFEALSEQYSAILTGAIGLVLLGNSELEIIEKIFKRNLSLEDIFTLFENIIEEKTHYVGVRSINELIRHLYEYATCLNDINLALNSKVILDQIEEFFFKYNTVLVQCCGNEEVIKCRAAIINESGNALKGLAEYQKAIVKFQESIELKEKIGNITGIGNSYANISACFAELKQYGKAIEYGELAYSTRLKMNDGYKIYESLRNMLQILLDAEEITKAHHFIDETKVFLEKYPQFYVGFNSILRQFFKAAEKSRNKEINKIFNKFLQIICSQLNDESYEIIKNKGSIYQEEAEDFMICGEYRLANNRYENAYFLFHMIGYKDGAIRCLRRAGNLFETMRDYETALMLYKSSEEYSSEQCIEKAITQACIAHYYLKRENRVNTLKYLEYAKSILDSNDKSESLVAYINQIEGLMK